MGTRMWRKMRSVPGTSLRTAARMVWLIATLTIAGCAVPPPPGAPTPPRVEIVTTDSRAFQYGRSGVETFNNPAINEKARLLFGSDWGTIGGRGRLATVAAPEFFLKSSEPRLVKIEEWEYIAIQGCVPKACASHRGLMLIRSGGERLLARLDEGGFTHYYAFGAGMGEMSQQWAAVDAAWRALERASGWLAG